MDGSDPMEEQLRRIRAEKQAKFEAEMAEQRRQSPLPEQKVPQGSSKPQPSLHSF